jgi:hypothetical protein
VVGVVTFDELFADPGPKDPAGLDDCVISDDLAEYAEEGFSSRTGPSTGNEAGGCRKDGDPLHSGIEMTLIDPQTKDVFRRSRGGPSAPASGGSRRSGRSPSGSDGVLEPPKMAKS